MENDDFYRDFMTSVQNPVPAEPPHEPKKKTWWIVGGIAAGLVAVILIVVGVMAIITRNTDTNLDDEDVMDAEISAEPPEETVDVGSAINYNESGEIISIRMGCTNNEKRYDFYKDNTYEVSPLHVVEADEVGTYTVIDKILIMKPMDDSDRAADISDLSRLVDGTEILECEQYDDM